jgi:hypothetical protein
MPSLQEIRQQYPQYKDLSDQQLLDGLHAKFYSDLDKESFYQKVGVMNAAAPQASPQRLTPEQEKLFGVSNATLNTPLSGPAAVIGNLSHAGATTGETAVNTGAYILERLGAISPKTEKQVNNFMKKSTEIYKISDDTSDPFNKAAQENPSATLVRLPIYAAGITATNVPKAVGGLLTSPLNIAGSAALTGGMAADLPKDQQNQAALIGGLFQGAFDAAGGIAGSVANKLLTKQSIPKQAMANVSDDILGTTRESILTKMKGVLAENTAKWDAIKAVPGQIDATLPRQITESLAKDLPPSLTKQPIVLQDLLGMLKESPSMENAVTIRNFLKENAADFFTASGVTRGNQVLYKSLLKNVEDQIRAIVPKTVAGVNLLDDAIKHYADKVSPLKALNLDELLTLSQKAEASPLYGVELNKATSKLLGQFGTNPAKTKEIIKLMADEGLGRDMAEQAFIKSQFDNILANPGSIKPNLVLGKLNKWAQDMDGVISKENLKIVPGIQKLLEKVGAVGGAPSKNAITDLTSQYLSATAGSAALGGLVGYQVGGPLGAIAGAGSIVVAKKMIGDFLNTPKGIAILKGIAEGRPWAGPIKKALATLTAEELARLGANNE